MAFYSGLIGDSSVGSNAISSGQIGSLHLASAAILSANIGSGQIGTAHLLSGYITSGAFGSGQIGEFAVTSGAVNSGNIASGAVANFPFASGAVNSGHLGSGSVMGRGGAGTASIASGSIGTNDMGSGAILSAHIASGNIGENKLSSGCILSSHIGSGQVAGNHMDTTISLARQAVKSGHIASGSIGRFHLANNIGNVAGGQPIFAPQSIFGQAAGGVFHIASGSIGPLNIGSGNIRSGNVASGQIGSFHIGSGTTFTAVALGISDLLVTTEVITGFLAVHINKSGLADIAMAAISGRMPAVGIAVSGAVSGGTIMVLHAGIAVSPISGFLDASGRMGHTLYVGRSGVVTALEPTGNSGDLIQKIGVTVLSGTMIVQPGGVYSGLPSFGP